MTVSADSVRDVSLRDQLIALAEKDHSTRTQLLKAGRLYDGYDEAMQAFHRDNAQALNAIVDLHGWPGMSLVGLEGCRAAWLVAQHAIVSPVLQRKFLNLLKQAAENGDVPKRQVAMLTDRIRFNEGKPQVYGTVLDWNEKGELDCLLQNPQQVDQRRVTVGLPPFKDSLKADRQAVKAEGGKAPADYEAYRQAADAWAKQTGWR